MKCEDKKAIEYFIALINSADEVGKEVLNDVDIQSAERLLGIINRQKTEIDELRNNCEEFNTLIEKALALCDDKDSTIDGLFETIESWEKTYETARSLAYEEFARELKSTSRLITRKKIERLLKKKVGEQK